MTSVPTTPSRSTLRPRRRRRVGVGATSLVAVSTFGLLATLTGTAQAAAAPVGLGNARDYAVLAGAGVTNTGATTVTGDVGSFPLPTVGLGITTAPGSTNHGADTDTTPTQNAQIALTNAMTDAKNAPATATLASGTLSGRTLTAGVYNSAGFTLGLTGKLTLDGGGSYDSVFIFQATSDLITAGSSTVELTNGAQACNVFWQVTSSATLGGSSTFVGTILAQTAITLGNRAKVEGRVLASSAAVTLDQNVITRPDDCHTGSVPITTTTTPTTTTTTAPPADGSTPSTASGSAGTTRRPTTYGQVRRVPVGAVDTGDGSTS